MKIKTRFVVAVFAVIAMLASGSGAAQEGQPKRPDVDHVIIISIDGLAAFHLENRALHLPNIRELIAAGVWAESSQTVFPSVTHPSHTTITTGVSPRLHGVLGNRMRNRVTGESFHVTNLPRSQSVRVPTIFDAAHAKGKKTAAFFWPETKDDAAIDFNIPEVFDQNDKASIAAVRPERLAELRDNGVPIDLYFRWYGDLNLHSAADAVLAQAAGHVIRRHKPNLLAIHILATDMLQHAYGPKHYLAHAALTAADNSVGILRRAVEEAGIAGRTVFFIVADHGFHQVSADLNLYPLLALSGLADKVALHPGGWHLFIELKPNFDPTRDGAAFEKFLQGVKVLDGVSKVLTSNQFHTLGLPTYEENPHISGQYLVLAGPETHLIADPAGRTSAPYAVAKPRFSHGDVPTRPQMYPAFVAAGAGILRGQRIGHVRNVDIAPTVSFLLDLGMKDMSGRILEELFVKEAEVRGQEVAKLTDGLTRSSRPAKSAGG